MKIFNYLNYEVEQKNFLYEALEINIEEKNIISFVGGGGKTTSIYTLAKELSKLGKKIVVTTTTHMHMPEDFIDFKGNVNEIIERFKSENLITVGIKDKDGKIVGDGEKIAEKLINLCDFLLIEADGARMHPLKVPANYEPVILKNTTMVVGVAGIDSLFKSINKICHRPEQVCKVLSKNYNHKINTKDIANILGSEEGQRKNVKDCFNAKYRAIINKVDNDELLIYAKEICKYLYENNIKGVITSYKQIS